MEREELKLSIFSPERRLIEAVPVDQVVLTSTEGQIQILPGHVSIVGMLSTGAFSYQHEKDVVIRGVISTGFFQVKANEVFVMAENFELKTEIDLERAKKAQQLAEGTLQQADLSEEQFRKHQLKLHRSMVRQQIVSEPLAKKNIQE